MIQINEKGTVRIVYDDENPRIYSTEYRCKGCNEWVDAEDTVWIPNFSEGEPFHVDCAPPEEED